MGCDRMRVVFAAHLRVAAKRAGCALLALLVIAGCSHNRTGGWTEGGRFKSSKDYLKMALEAQCADDRREGVVGLAAGRDAASDWAVKVFDTIARTDTDAMVRCEAVKALRASAGPQHVPTLLKLLSSAGGGVEGVRPAPGRVRWEAAKLLKLIIETQGIEDSQRDETVHVLLDNVAKDDDRNVRLAAIEALAHLPQRPVVVALIDALETEDYAIKHTAERSLVVLTGATNNCDAEAWRKWLAGKENPCQDAGTVSPQIIEVKKKAWWERGWDW
jgi:HEAT repeat protein